jgi:molybdopterin biosynthesis enzyme
MATITQEVLMNRATAFAIRTGAQLAKAGCEVVHFQSAIRGGARYRIATARRALRKSRYLAEDLTDGIVLTVRRRPLKAISIIAGVAFGIGALTGWLGRGRG